MCECVSAFVRACVRAYVHAFARMYICMRAHAWADVYVLFAEVHLVGVLSSNTSIVTPPHQQYKKNKLNYFTHKFDTDMSYEAAL